MPFFRFVLLAIGLLPLGWLSKALISAEPPSDRRPCRIQILEKGSGWPVPLVELRTTHEVRLVSDNAGVICFDLPELMHRETWFSIQGHGYGVRPDGFGYRGVRLTPKPGESLRIEVERSCIAKRIGRLTGGGLFAESQKLGEQMDWKDGPILGSDSIQTTTYRGRKFWLWGDTNVPRYPLGIFHAPAATTPLKPLTEAKPPLRLPFEYFTDARGAARGVAEMPGSGPTWVTAVVALPDSQGRERLVGSYMKVKPPLEAYEWGLCVWDDDSRSFKHHKTLWTKSVESPKEPLVPRGHPAFWADEQGQKWLLFGNPFPTIRVLPTFEAWEDPSCWQPVETPKSLKSSDGQDIRPHSGSIAWHPWRKRWVTVFMQWWGKPSAFGEIWYAEGDSPFGPWGPCVKVLSHDNYTFYNPVIHADWFEADSPILLFEGTYTRLFADKPEPTPRYEYNQILYRLDLDDPALAPAQKQR
ncbi:MAG: hypothetical protein NZM31_13935 [Gemmatales bacterium]|nr:hypothetical protein [Gemmatales bacterium]MDW8388096.1 hypothetical protein [Gemmatales bacterium]